MMHYSRAGKAILFRLLEWGQVNRLFRRINRGKIKILLFHSIDDGPGIPAAIPAREFERMLNYLRETCRVVSLDGDGAWSAMSTRRINVALTFDDGFLS